MQRKSAYAITYMGGAFICAAVSICFHDNIDMVVLPKIVLALSLASLFISLAELIHQFFVERVKNHKLEKVNVTTLNDELALYKEVNQILNEPGKLIGDLVTILNCLSFFVLIIILFLDISIQEIQLTGLSILAFGIVVMTFGLQEVFQNDRHIILLKLKEEHSQHLILKALKKV